MLDKTPRKLLADKGLRPAFRYPPEGGAAKLFNSLKLSRAHFGRFREPLKRFAYSLQVSSKKEPRNADAAGPQRKYDRGLYNRAAVGAQRRLL